MLLEPLFAPRSIAVIGASTDTKSVGHTLARNLVASAYRGKVYLVNPKTAKLLGQRCYKNVLDIKGTVDLSIIIVPARSVPLVLRESAKKGVRAVVVISSGFRETGGEGVALEEEIRNIARQHKIALLGPNCLGFLCPRLGLNASFAPRLPNNGPIAFFSQSGALCTALLDLVGDDLGFSYFVSTGNKTIIDEQHLLTHCAADRDTSVLSVYAESLSDARRFISLGRSLIESPKPKPIIALKSGVTDSGRGASSSHTGALAGSDAAYEALFRQARIVRAKTVGHLRDLLTVFSSNLLPSGKRLAIITNAGGLGVLATDAAVRSGLTLARLSENTLFQLRSLLPPAASVRNPVDVLGDALADRYEKVFSIVSEDRQADMFLVIVTPQTMTQAKKTAEAIASLKKTSGKPVVAVFAGKRALAPGIALLKREGVAVLPYPEAGAESLGALAQVAEWHTKRSVRQLFSFDDIDPDKARKICAAAKRSGREMLTEEESWSVLETYGFALPKKTYVTNAWEALDAARTIGQTVALKIVSPDILHKSDVDGVIVNVPPEEADKGYEQLLRQVKHHVPSARLEGALVVEMARPGGTEIILGLKKEPGLGTAIMVGLGGIFVETFRDTALRFAPLSEDDADEMLRELKSYSLLRGARGKTGIDLEKLKEYIGRLARLAEDFPSIEELDINPLVSYADSSGFRVLDARIRIQKGTVS